jgi:hypothetical protein
MSRRVVSAVLAVALAPSLSLSAEGPVLAAPHQDLSEVVPMRILDEIDLSGATPKVESKPALSWRPALNAPQPANAPQPTPDLDTRAVAPSNSASVITAPGNAVVKVAAKPETEPQLKPVTTAPTLVAPQVNAAAPALQPAADKPVNSAPLDGVLVDGAASEATDQDDSIKAADAPLLPLRAHRASPGTASSTPAAPPAAVVVEKKLAATPAPAEKPPVAAPVVVTPAVEKPATAPTLATAKPQLQTQPQTQFQPPSRPLAAAPGVAPPQAAPLQTAQPLPPLSRNMRNLRSRLRSVLSFYYRKPLNTVEHDPWELMHAMLAYELHSRVRDGGPNGPYMTLVGHLCFNRPSKRQQLMIINKDGKLEAEVGVGVQGHRGQFLAMLAQCNVSPEYPIRVGGRELTIRDLIESEQRSCYAKTELTFKLIGLGHYLSSDATWVNDQGETWDIPRLIREERAQPIRGAACGGTHRLSGLSLAYRRREARGEPLDGEYAEAARFVNQYQAYAFQMQNEDGSLSTEWFAGRGAEEDIERRLRTTGHILEWLVYSLPDDQLQSTRTVRTVNYLTELLASHADQDWHLGSIGHAVHALVLYDKRVFRPHDTDTTQVVSAVDPTGNLYRDYPIYRGVMRNGPPEPAGFLGLFGNSKSSSNRR